MAAPSITTCLEGPGGLPLVAEAGLNTLKNINFNSGSNSCDLPAATTINGSSVAGIGSITSSSTTAEAFGVTNTGIFTGTDIVGFTANSATSGTVFLITANGLTTGIAQTITSSGTMTTTGSLLTLTANSATTAAGLLRVNANALTSGIAAVITSSATAITGAGRLLRVDHTGTTGTSAILSEFASAANDETVIFRITASDVLALGTAADIQVGSMTTGSAIVITPTSLTTGKAISITDLAALTTGIGLNITSAATAITGAGRLIYSNHSGATGTSAILNEFRSTANDETVIAQVTATAALASGKVLNLSAVALTTGTVLSAVNADALTTGTIANLTSNSADVTARKLVQIINDNTAAVGAVPLYLQQDAVGTTHFKTLILLGTIGIYVSDETTPNAALTAAKGSICLNGSATGQAFWNTDGVSAWTALA